MAGVVARDGVAATLDVALDGVAHVTQMASGAAFLEPLEEAGPRRLDQVLLLLGDDPDPVGAAGVGVVAGLPHHDVEGDDVPFPEDGPGRGDAVDEDLVHGGADGLGEAAVALARGHAPALLDQAVGELGEGQGGDPGPDLALETVEDRGEEAPGLLHEGDLAGALPLDQRSDLRKAESSTFRFPIGRVPSNSWRSPASR